MFLLNLSYRFISGDVDIRNKEIIQKSELKTKNMGRERNTSREINKEIIQKSEHETKRNEREGKY